MLSPSWALLELVTGCNQKLRDQLVKKEARESEEKEKHSTLPY